MFQLKLSLDINNLDRRNYILLSFLKTSFINLNNISLILNISRRTLSKDLNKIKKILGEYNLTYTSLNSKGIQLIGCESDKKKMLNNILFILFLDRDYLPNIFDFIFEDFNTIIDEQIQEIIKKIILKKNIIAQSYIILQLEIIFFIAIVRKKENSNIFSFKFEIKTILSICNKYNIKNIFNNHSSELEKIKNFIKYLHTNSEISITLTDITYISLISRFSLIEFKNKLKMVEFYMMNKEFEKNYYNFYNDFVNLIEVYFKKTFNYKIDSFDKISFFLILKKYLYLKQINLNKNIIVYNTLQIFILNEIIDQLKEKDIFIFEAISIYTLKSYLKNNYVKNILIFENLDFKGIIVLNKNINIVEVSFPLNEGDYLNIKQKFNKKKSYF